VTGNHFSPTSLTLRRWDYVLVTDKDVAAPHTFTIDALNVHSGQMTQGDTFTYRFTTTGSFSFRGEVHPSMTGTVTVTS